MNAFSGSPVEVAVRLSGEEGWTPVEGPRFSYEDDSSFYVFGTIAGAAFSLRIDEVPRIWTVGAAAWRLRDGTWVVVREIGGESA